MSAIGGKADVRFEQKPIFDSSLTAFSGSSQVRRHRNGAAFLSGRSHISRRGFLSSLQILHRPPWTVLNGLRDAKTKEHLNRVAFRDIEVGEKTFL